MELINVEDCTGSDGASSITDSVLQSGFIVNLLDSFEEKESMWQRLKKGLPEIKRDKIKDIEKDIDISSDYEELRELEKSIKQANSDIAEVLRRIEELETIKEVNISKADIEFSRIHVLTGRVEKEILAQLEKNKDIYVEKFAGDERTAAVIFYLKKDVEKTVQELNIHKIELPLDRTPMEKIKELKEELKKLGEKIESYNNDIKRKFLEKKFKYEILRDVYENRRSLELESGKTGRTKYLSIISGWIPGLLKGEITGLLKKDYPQCHIEFSKPDKNEKPPVILKNGGFSDAFEVVTNLYGTPSYNWIDPTPYMAPFFALFFGLCLTDAGYGLIIAGLCIWAIKNLKLTKGLKKFMFLLLWGGAASVVTGALTGGWFGNAFSNIKVIDNLKIIDPLKKPEIFLYFSVMLGYIQVIFGIILSFIQNFKSGDVKAALFEELPWLVILLSIPLYFAGGLFNSISRALIPAGLAGVVLLSGHKNKNIFARIGAGLYKLYSGTDYFKDMISYSRLFALGMGTAILGMAVNEMAVQASGIRVLGLPVGYLILAVVFIGGHIFNIVMSMLSAYIHTSRLQYVEFFKWFFKGGGRSFSPFSWKNRRVSLIQ